MEIFSVLKLKLRPTVLGDGYLTRLTNALLRSGFFKRYAETKDMIFFGDELADGARNSITARIVLSDHELVAVVCPWFAGDAWDSTFRNLLSGIALEFGLKTCEAVETLDLAARVLMEPNDSSARSVSLPIAKEISSWASEMGHDRVSDIALVFEHLAKFNSRLIIEVDPDHEFDGKRYVAHTVGLPAKAVDVRLNLANVIEE